MTRPDPEQTSDAHVVIALNDIAVKCGQPDCNGDWAQAIDPAARIGWLVCPVCTHAAPVTFAYELLDQYATR
jgi:hypothetical protein